MDVTSKATAPLAVLQPSQSLLGAEAQPLLHKYFQECTSYLTADAKAALKPFQARAIPLPIIGHILGYLLISHQPLILHPNVSKSQGHSSNTNTLSVLRACRLFYQIGIPLLYGKNTITTSSPAASYDFDAHIANIPVKTRQLIKDVKLEIDWADDLWKKFPLIAQQLGQMPLRQLTIILSYKDKYMERQPPALAGKVVDQQFSLSEKAARKIKMSCVMAEAKLRAEKKMLKGLVEGCRTLKVFRLEGFRDQAFADMLQALIGGISNG